MPWWAGLWPNAAAANAAQTLKRSYPLFTSVRRYRGISEQGLRDHIWRFRIWTGRGTLAEIRAELIKSHYSKQEEYFPFEAEMDPSPTGLQPAPPQRSFGLWHMNKWMNRVRTGVAVLLVLRSYWGEVLRKIDICERRENTDLTDWFLASIVLWPCSILLEYQAKWHLI